MKSLVTTIILLAVLAGMAVPAIGAPTTIKFTQTTGGWDYVASAANVGVFQFKPIIVVDQGLGSTLDPIVGLHVKLPDLALAWNGTNYVLTPVAPATISIFNPVTATVHFVGDLGIGNAYPLFSAVTGYPEIKADVTNISIIQTAPASPTLQYIINAGLPMDFVLSLDKSPTDIAAAISAGTSIFNGSVSGSMSVVPAPGAILLGSIGVAFVGWMKRRRSL